MYINLNPVYGQNYRAGQIYLTRQDGNFISDGIAWFEYKTGGTPELEKFTHCGIVIDWMNGISAQPEGVNYENLIDIFNDPHRRIVFVEPKLLDTLGSYPLVMGMIQKIGIRYDWKLACGFAVVNSWLGRKLSERIRKEILRWFDCLNRVVCSEVVAQVLYEKNYCYDPNTKKMPNEIAKCGCIKPWKN